MNTAPKSPGYYGSEIYGYIGNTDPSFSKDISQEQFFEDLQDEAYAAEIYGYLTKKDRSFAKDVSLDQFIVDVKKKEIVTASAGGDTSSELLPTTEVTPEVAQALGEAVALQGFEPNPFRPDDPYGYTPQEQERRFALAQQVDEQQQVIEGQPEIIGGTAQQTVPFVSGLGLEHDEYGAKYTDSFVEDMRNLYSPYGFRVEGEVHDGRGDIKVYNNVDGKLLSHTVRVRSGYIPNSEVGALKDFLYEIPAQRIDMPDDQRGMTEKALRAQEMRPTYRQNRDGKTVSTHLMAYAEVDGKFVAYPTLFPDRPESISTRFDMWTELDGNEALDEAYRRDEVFVFDTEEEAKMFAEGAWKDIETIDLEGERLYRERGRDYYSEQAAEFELDRLNTEYKFVEKLKPGERVEGEVPAAYQKYFIEGNRVRPDIEIMRSGLESEVDMMFDSLNDEETMRLREDFDVILGKRQKAKAAEAAEVNQAARIQQDKLQIESLKKFGVRINDLANYEPKTQREFQEVNNIIGRFNTAITDRMVAAKMYEKAELYYDKKHNKQVTDDYVDGLATWGLEWDKATDKGNAMALLLKTNFGLIDEEDEEKVAKQIAAYMDEDDHRLSRQKTRVNEAATSHQYWQNLGDNPLDYAISIISESMGQLLPLGATIVPYFAVPGAIKGAATGMVGGPYGALVGSLRGSVMGAGRAALMYGMPLSEFALEMGNSIIEEGNERGYDWADPQQALLAFNDKELWRAGTVRGVQRGVPIALASHLSNAVAGRVFTSSALAPMKTRIVLGLAERVTVDPALEMAGEYGALVMEGKYTGSLSDMREIIAEGLGAIGQSTPMYALNIAQDAMTNNTFDLAMGLIDPKVLAEENVSNKRIMDWTDNAQKTGKITAETADFIRKNVGYRREANEILGRKAGARPGRKSAVLGRIMELLEAKDVLTRSASVREVFKKRIADINEEIAIIAETGKLPESPIVDLSLVAERTQRDKPSGYRIGKKAYTRAAFVNELDKLSRRQLFNAQVYNDPLVAQLLIQKTQDAVQKRKAKKIPVRDEAGVSPEMEQEAQDFSEANEEDLKAQESETLTDNRLATILGNIAAKLDAQEKLSDVEQQFYEEHKDDIDGYTNEEGEFVPGIRGEVVEAEEIIPPGEITPEEEEVTPEEEPTPDIEPDPGLTVEETVEFIELDEKLKKGQLTRKELDRYAELLRKYNEAKGSKPTVVTPEPTPEPTVEEEPTTVEEVAEAIEEELMPELTKGGLAKLLKERPNLRLAYFGKDGRRDTEFTIGYNRATGKYFFSDNNRIYRGSDYDKFSQALKRLLYQKRRGMVSGDFIGLYDNLMNSEPVLAKFDFEMNNITEAEPTVEEAPTVEEEVAPEEEVTEQSIRDKIAIILGATNSNAQRGIKEKYKRARAKIERRKPSEAREAELKELNDKEAEVLADMSQRYRIARNALSVLNGKGLTKAAREGSKTREPLTREEIQQVADLAGVNVETLIEAEPTVEEVTPEPTPEPDPDFEFDPKLEAYPDPTEEQKAEHDTMYTSFPESGYWRGALIESRRSQFISVGGASSPAGQQVAAEFAAVFKVLNNMQLTPEQKDILGRVAHKTGDPVLALKEATGIDLGPSLGLGPTEVAAKDTAAEPTPEPTVEEEVAPEEEETQEGDRTEGDRYELELNRLVQMMRLNVKELRKDALSPDSSKEQRDGANQEIQDLQDVLKRVKEIPLTTNEIIKLRTALTRLVPKEALESVLAERKTTVAPEPTVEEELTEDEQIRKAAEKRAVIEGISVEVAEKQIRAERAQNMTRRIATEVRKARAELTELKGKNDKASRVRRKVLNEFLTNIRDNMALDEAIAIRDATVEAEPTVEEDPFLLENLEKGLYGPIEQATTAEEIYRAIYDTEKGGGLTAKKVYEAMSKNQNLNEVERAIAKSLAEKLDSSVKIRGNARMRGAAAGKYHYNWTGYRNSSGKIVRTSGQVTLSRIEIGPAKGISLEDYAETVLHEGIHAATTLAIAGGNPEFRAEMSRIAAVVKKHLKGMSDTEIRSKYPELYAYLRKGAKVGRRSGRAYRMDPDEIMAWGLTNPEMQSLMKSIKDPKGPSVWSSFVTAVRELMGLAESENTAFDSLLTAYEGAYSYKVGEAIDPNATKGGSSAMGPRLNIQISDELYQAAIFYGLNENGFIPDNALQKDINAFKSLLERNGLTLAKAKNGGLYVAIKNTRIPYDLYTAYDVQQEELNREIAEIEALEEQAQRERELQERLREIHDADVKPYTGRDFEGPSKEMAMPDKLVDPASTIADVVTKGRAMGYRDAAIRALLIKRFGKENIDAINQAMTEYFDAGRAIPEAFGNVEGGIDVGREIYSDVRRQLDEFIVSKRKKLTKKQRAERIADLRQRFPEDKELNDTKLLRKHSKDFIPPSMSIVRAAALNFLESNEQFKQQPKQVQEELLVSFDKALKTRANRDIQARIMRLRFALRERKRGEKNLKKVQNELRALIREVLPKSGYSAAQVNTLLEAVVNTNEKTIATQAEKVLNLVEGQRNKMRKALIKNMVGFVKKSKTTYRTKSGRIRTRTLDAPGQAYFEAIFPILSALAKNDLEAISRINDKLVNNPDVDLAVARYMAREQLTTREQRLVDEAAAFDMFGDLQEKSLEELEAIFEDIRLAAGFSRVALKNTRLARAARYKRVDDAATDSLAEEYPFLIDEQGNPLNRNQIEAIRNIINQKLRSGTYREKVEALRAYMKLWSTRGVGKVMENMARPVRSLGTLTNGVSNFLYRNVYDAVNEMDEQYLVGAFEQKDELDAMAASIEGIKSFKDLIAILYDGNTKNFTLRTKQGASYQNVFNKDQAMRIYALSLNPVQAQKLEAQGFTPEVMAELKEFIGPELVQFADKAVEYLSTSYYESVNDVYRRVNDINLPYVENYFPTRSVTGQIQQELLTTADFSRIFDAETSPAFKDRTDTKSEVDLSASLSFSQTLTNHIEQMERYKAYAEGTKQINHLFKNKMLDASLEAFKLNDHMRKMVNWAINPNSARLAAVQKYEWLDPLLNAFSKAVLGFKFFQIPKQLSSFITALQEYQYRTEDRIPIIDPIIDRLAFMAEYAAILPAVFLDLGRVLSTETPKGPVYEAMGISKTFARRLEQFSTGNIYTLESGVTTFRSIDKQEAAVGKGIRFFRKAQAGPIMIGDAGAIMAYLVTYRRNIKNGMDPAEALLKFNDYNITQQSRRPGDKVPAQISGNALERTFIMFGSSIIGLTNNAIIGWQNMVRDVKRGKAPKSSDARRVWLSIVSANVLFSLVSNASIFLLSDDDDEKRRALQDALISPVNGLFMIPIVGGSLEAMAKAELYGHQMKGSSIDVFERTYRDAKKGLREGDVVEVVKPVTELVLGANLDPFIALGELVGNKMFDLDVDVDDATYEALGIPKSQRPE